MTKLEKFTTCPMTGEENSWVEEGFTSGKWVGRSSACDLTVSAEHYEALRLRYEKINNARLMAKETEE